MFAYGISVARSGTDNDWICFFQLEARDDKIVGLQAEVADHRQEIALKEREILQYVQSMKTLDEKLRNVAGEV